MATVTGLTAARMKEISDAQIMSSTINGSGHLIFTLHNGSTVDAGSVIGPTGPTGPTGSVSKSGVVATGLLASDLGGAMETEIKTIQSTTQSAGWVFTLADVATVVESSSATDVTFTIPLNSTTAFPIGSLIEVFQGAAGQINIAGASGVTVLSSGSRQHTAGQYATVGLRKRSTDVWVLTGDLV